MVLGAARWCVSFFCLWRAMLMEGHQGYSLRNPANYITRDVCPLARMELSLNRVLWGGWCYFRWGMEGKGIEKELEFAKGFSWCPGRAGFHTSSRGQQCTNVHSSHVDLSSKLLFSEIAKQWAWLRPLTEHQQDWQSWACHSPPPSPPFPPSPPPTSKPLIFLTMPGSQWMFRSAGF